MTDLYRKRLEEAQAISEALVAAWRWVKSQLAGLPNRSHTAPIPQLTSERTMMDKGMFRLVAEMNEAFGNPRGNPTKPDVPALHRQCVNIAAEFKELMAAFGVEAHTIISELPPKPEEAFKEIDYRDALCDIVVFALGAMHRLGVDGERDMEAVVDAVMTRFCKDEKELLATRAKYDAAGVEYTVQGEFPRVFLRSAKDQQMPEYPAGKFLKSAFYRQPVFNYVLYDGPLPRRFFQGEAE